MGNGELRYGGAGVIEVSGARVAAGPIGWTQQIIARRASGNFFEARIDNEILSGKRDAMKREGQEAQTHSTPVLET